MRFSWYTGYHEYQEKGLVTSKQIQWAFLYGDCEHQVWPVDAGARLSIAYDVFMMPEVKSVSLALKGQSQSDNIYQSLKTAFKDHEGFAKDGCSLAFGLSHSYPKTTEPFWKGLEDRLKGPDAVLLQAINRCGIPYAFKAAFHRETDHNDGDYRGEDGAREWGAAQDAGLSDTVLNAIYRNGLERFQVSPVLKHDGANTDV